MKKLSSSFVTGAIALVFAVLGYQTALLVHYSAVTKIAADRDCPDTVYVTAVPSGASHGALHGASAGASSSGAAVRRNASHGVVASHYRRSVPPRRVESFDFDPNTASVEDLIRLGFSPKQAESINNYRKKGGRFRRRSDFAKSYVVSDSIYARLEKHIRIPAVDLNKADSAAFDSLPGIGGYFARKMVEHRNSLHGYSYPEQLMDIYHFDREKFDSLKDLICVSAPEPYPLWTYPADSLRRHPYIKDAMTARGIVFFREHNPKEKWTVKNLALAGVIPQDQASKLEKCVIAGVNP